MVFTNCYTRAASTSAIELCARRTNGFDFIASSFSVLEFLFKRSADFLSAIMRETENLKSRFDIMLSRSKLTGLFENQIRRIEMERAVAIKRLSQLLGKKLGYRINEKAPTPEEREAARIELVAAIAERKAAEEKAEARFNAILEADSEYQALKEARKAARQRVDRLGSITRHHKITVGTSEGMFFLVKAEGDSWEEIIDKLTTKQAA